jgi:hypothetical protein
MLLFSQYFRKGIFETARDDKTKMRNQFLNTLEASEKAGCTRYKVIFGWYLQDRLLV